MISTNTTSGSWSVILDSASKPSCARMTSQPAWFKKISALRRMVLLSSMTITLTPFNLSLSTRSSSRIAGRAAPAASLGTKHYGTCATIFSAIRTHRTTQNKKGVASQRPFAPADAGQALLPGFLAGISLDTCHGPHGAHDRIRQGRDAHELPHAHIGEGQGDTEATMRRTYLIINDINLVGQAGDALLHVDFLDPLAVAMFAVVHRHAENGQLAVRHDDFVDLGRFAGALGQILANGFHRLGKTPIFGQLVFRRIQTLHADHVAVIAQVACGFVTADPFACAQRALQTRLQCLDRVLL